VTIDGRCRKITKREAIVAQMVDKSASADLRATKMLFDMIKDVEHKAGDIAPPPEPRRLAAADKRSCSSSSRGCASSSCRGSKKQRRQSPRIALPASSLTLPRPGLTHKNGS
jgi:hypothetical protein